MKLAKLSLVLASFSSLFVAAGGVALADPPSFQVSATVVSTCIVSSAGSILFGNYNHLAADPTPGNADLTIACNVGQIPKITLGWGIHGGAGLYNSMNAGGTDTLQYQIFQPSVPGNNPTTTQWNGDTHTLTGNQATAVLPYTYTMYGQIPPGQNVAAGTYTDTVTVTVNL